MDLETKANKRITWIQSYQQYLCRVIKPHIKIAQIYERFLSRYVKIKSSVMKSITKVYSAIILKTAGLHLHVIKLYKATIILFRDFARISLTPINYIRYYYLTVIKYLTTDPIEHLGVHYITALMGGGKSSLMYDVAEKIRTTTSKGTYVNVEMERPRYDPIDDMWYKFHPEFDIEEFWGVKTYIDENGEEKQRIEQLKKFDLEFDNLILDEWLSKMNHRQNNTKLYKEVFIALISAIAHMRHQHMKRIYVASQLDTTDIQLMAMFKYIHEVEVDLKVPYWQWVRTGSLEKDIQGWTIWTYKYKRNRKKSSTEKILYKKYYRPRTSNLDYFESMNQSKIYDQLPQHQIKYKKGVE